jgi:poly(3-hydroxybutyrate) depolymerase
VMAGASNATLARSGLMQVADANRFVIVMLVPPPAGGSHTGWYHPQTDCGGAAGVVGGGNCGASSTSPSDVPYVMAAVNSIKNVYPNLDTSRFYDVGGSSGANMARELICDSRSASTFRGVATLGGGANAKYGTTGSGSCPAGVKDRFYLEIVGKNSQQDPYSTFNVGTDHSILGYNNTRAWWSSYLGGCSAPVHMMTGSGVLSDVNDYSCTNVPQSSQFEAVAVTNGGHTWCALDTTPQTACGVASNNTGGWATAPWVWNWFATRQWGG